MEQIKLLIKVHLRLILRHRTAVVIVSLLLAFLFFSNTLLSSIPPLSGEVYYYFHPKLSTACHFKEKLSLPDISDAKPRKDKSIFFFETSCDSFINGKITIKVRQACAVESAAKMHPNMDVYLLYASPGVIKNENTESDRFLAAIRSYPNVKIYHVDIARYLHNTPIENLWREKKLARSWYALSHTSDVLRYLTLWKYGGIYLDLDVIVIRSLERLPLNYAGMESVRNVAVGVLGFSYAGKGHKYARMCLNDLKQNFSLWDWGYNGPGIITRLAKTICGVDSVPKMRQKLCDSFKIYPREAFYAIPFRTWMMPFNASCNEEVFFRLRDSYILHVWNRLSADVKVPLDSNASYLLYARKYCPKVIEQCDQYF